MQKRTRRFLAMLFLVWGMLLAYGCAGGNWITTEPASGQPGQADRGYQHGGGPPPWAPAHGHRAKQYQYYASAQVYFDVERKIYFYYSDGDWRVSASLPDSIRVNLGEYVTLEMGTDQPYIYHSDVVRQYPPGQSKGKGKGKGQQKGGKMQ
jgi:hypothetical protein